MKSGIVHKKDIPAGRIWEDEDGFHFQYNENYLANPEGGSVSKTLPKREEEYFSENMLPFFDGLIPEGWLLEIAIDNWKINRRDRMELLLTLCKECIGDISIIREK